MKKISAKKKQEALELLESRHMLPFKNSYLDDFMSDKEVFNALLICGADPNYFESYFEVPILSLAQSRSYYHAFKSLLEHGADPNVPSSTDADKKNIVFELIAWYPNDLRYLKLLLKYKVDLNVMNPKTGDRLLTWKMKTGRFSRELVELILEHGGDPNLKNRDGSTIFDLIDGGKIEVDEELMALLYKHKA